jgi:hypothetical protein
MAQLRHVREPLPPHAQQEPHAQAAQRAVAEPADERRAGDYAAEVHPRAHVAQRLARVRPLDRGAHVGPALAQRDDDRRLPRPAREEMHQRSRVFRHGGKAAHRDALHRPAQPRRELHDALAAGAGVRVLHVKRAGHDEDARRRAGWRRRLA